MSVTVDNTDVFAIGGSGAIVGAGAQLDTWTVAAKTGIVPQVADYTGTITVTYNQTVGGTSTQGTAVADVSMGVSQRKLVMSDPVLTKSKVYDTDATAVVVVGQARNVVGSDDVQVTASAVYDDALVGTNKAITVSYAFSGAQAARYIVPDDWVVTDGVIVRQTPELAISCDDLVYDGVSEPDPQVARNTSTETPTFEYKLRYAADETYAPAKPTAAANYTVRATVAQTDIMFKKQATANFRIYYVEGEARAEVVVDPSLSPVTVNGLDAALDPQTTNTDDALGYTKHDAEVVAQGGTVELRLVVGKASSGAENREGEVRARIEGDGLVMGATWDISVVKIVTLPDGSVLAPATVRELPSLVTIALDIPTGQTGKEQCRLYRFHGQGVDVLNATANSRGETAGIAADGKMVTQTRCFSTYALGYSEPTSASSGVLVRTGDDSGMVATAFAALVLAGLATAGYALLWARGRRRSGSR